MIKRFLKRAISTREKKVLIENFFSLSFLQVAGYIFPLITLPYLVRVLGPSQFGLIAFAQAFVQYFVIFTDYGFNLSATRDVSIHRENPDKIANIFNAVMFIKILFSIISFVVLCSLVFLIPKIRSNWLIYMYTFGIVLGNILFPVWFFQGMEKMRYITLLNMIGKFIFTIAIFIFIKKQEDFIYVPLISSLGSIVPGIVSLWIVYNGFKVKFILPKFESLRYQLKEGWHIFISTAAISLYTTSNTVILGFFINNTFVGYYSAAEKITNTVQKLMGPISQSTYPYVNKLADQSKESALKFLRKTLVLMGGFSLILSIGIFIFADLIVNIILGNQFHESIIVLRILAFLPFIIGLSNVFGIQTMLTFNMKEAFSRILISGGIINILLALLLVPFFKHIGTAVSVLITEIFVTTYMFLFLSSKKLISYKFILKGEM